MADDPWAAFRNPATSEAVAASAAAEPAAAPADAGSPVPAEADPWAGFRAPAGAAPAPTQAEPAPMAITVHPTAAPDPSNQATNAVVGQAPVIDEDGGFPITAPGQTPVVTAAPTVQGTVDPRVNASIDAGVRGVANGLTLNGADRFAAGMESLTGAGGAAGDYAGNLKREQAASAAAQVEHPVASITGNLVGGAMIPLGAMAAIPKGAGLLTKVGTGMAVGGGLGAVQGALESHDLTNADDVLNHGIVGGVIGGTIGGGIPVAARAVGGVYRLVASRFGEKAASLLSPEAAAALAPVLERDGPDVVLRRLQEGGPEFMLADAGENLTGMTQGQVLRAGGGHITKALTERNEGANGRVQAAVDDAVGVAEPHADIQAGIDQARANAVEPQFAAAAREPAPIGAGMDEIAGRPTVAAGLRDATKVAADNGTPVGSVVLDEFGQVVPSDAAETFRAGSGDRVKDALGHLVGNSRSALEEGDAIIASKKALSGPLYEQAKTAEVDYDSPAGQKLLELVPTIREKAGGLAKEIMDFDRTAPGGRWVGGPEPVEAAAAPGLGAPAKERAPVSLARHIAKNGGIDLDGGDAAAAGFDKWGIPFAGKVAHEKGRSIDGFWREKLIEDGYLPPDADGGAARDIREELFHALAEERAGRPQYRINAEARGRGVDPAMAAHEAELLDRSRGEVLASALKRGVDPREINPDALETAALSHASSDGTGDAFAHYQDALSAGHGADGGAGAAPGPVFHPNAETLHYYKMGLDARLKAAKADPAGGTLARSIQKLKDEFLGAMDEAVPGYRDARQVYSDHASMTDALDLGREAIRKGKTGEEIRRDLAGMSDAEKELYRTGAGHELRAKVDKTSDTADLAHVIFGKQATRDQVAALAPSRDAYARFKQAIANEKHTFTEATRPDMRAWTNAYRAAVEKANKLDASSVEGQAARQAVADLREHLGQIPTFERGAERSDFYDRLQAAFDKGGKILRSGDEAIHPSVLKRELDALSPSEWAIMRKGTRAEIDRLLGTKANDLVALKSALQGEGGWNTDKLAHLFGEEQAGKLIAAVKNEARMQKTFVRVVDGSQSAQRAASALAQGDKKAPLPPIPTSFGDLARLGLHGARKVAGKLLTRDTTEQDKELALALTRKGPEAMQLLGDVLGLPARRADLASRRATDAARAGNRAAATVGILGETAAETDRRRRPLSLTVRPSTGR